MYARQYGLAYSLPMKKDTPAFQRASFKEARSDCRRSNMQLLQRLWLLALAMRPQREKGEAAVRPSVRRGAVALSCLFLGPASKHKYVAISRGSLR